MTEQDDIQTKANEFLVLWQEQMATLMRDPEAMASTLKSMLSAQQAICTSNSNEMNQDDKAKYTNQPCSASFGGALVPDAILASRLEQCEARIAELESQRAEESIATCKKSGKRSRRNAA